MWTKFKCYTDTKVQEQNISIVLFFAYATVALH